MKNTVFVMNGKEYKSMLSIAKDLGKSRIYRKDFEKYGIEEVEKQPNQTTLNISADTPQEEVQQDNASELKNLDSNNDLDTQSKDISTEIKKSNIEQNNKDKDHKSGVVYTSEGTNILSFTKTNTVIEVEPPAEPPQDILQFNNKTLNIIQDKLDNKKITLEQFSKNLSKLTNNDIEILCNNKKLKLWKNIDNVSIRRMRQTMELKQFYFKGQKFNTYTKSDWSKISYESLEEYCKLKKLDYKKSTDKRIGRMYMVMALNKAGLKLSDYREEM